MKVKINNKVFDATVQTGNKVILEAGLNEGDMLFFNQWMTKALGYQSSPDGNFAHQYKKDLHFATDAKKGLLNGCYPVDVLSGKENKVEISYDQIKYNQ